MEPLYRIIINNRNTNNENEDSLIIYTNLNNVNILLTGDIGFQTELKLFEEYNLMRMDILKVGHHGFVNSSIEIFSDVIKPKYALI